MLKYICSVCGKEWEIKLEIMNYGSHNMLYGPKYKQRLYNTSGPCFECEEAIEKAVDEARVRALRERKGLS